MGAPLLPDGEWIQTYVTNRAWSLEHPRAIDVDIRDIARALSHICRFTGHVSGFYSVAEHSVWVSHLVPTEHALVGLLHDATEAYLGDMTSPLKKLIPAYKAIEAEHWRVIAEHFELPVAMPTSVKIADQHMLRAEQDQLQGGRIKQDVNLPTPHVPFTGRIQLLQPRLAERRFLARYHQLADRPALVRVAAGRDALPTGWPSVFDGAQA